MRALVARAPVQISHHRHVARPVRHRHIHPPRRRHQVAAAARRGSSGAGWGGGFAAIQLIGAELLEPSQLQLQ